MAAPGHLAWPIGCMEAMYAASSGCEVNIFIRTALLEIKRGGVCMRRECACCSTAGSPPRPPAARPAGPGPWVSWGMHLAIRAAEGRLLGPLLRGTCVLCILAACAFGHANDVCMANRHRFASGISQASRQTLCVPFALTAVAHCCPNST